MRERLARAFDRFIEAGDRSDREVAELLAGLGTDIAVDLKGTTKGHRAGIFALRPAPVQVGYLGYPATMGATYIDYIVADRTVIPEHRQDCYAESVVYLPDSYQVNDSARSLPARTPTRDEVGLPRTPSCSARSTTATRSPRGSSTPGCACSARSKAACFGCSRPMLRRRGTCGRRLRTRASRRSG